MYNETKASLLIPLVRIMTSELARKDLDINSISDDELDSMIRNTLYLFIKERRAD